MVLRRLWLIFGILFCLGKWIMGYLLVQGGLGLLDSVEVVPGRFHNCRGHFVAEL